MTLPFPTNTTDIIQKMINTIGRNITLYIENQTVCWNCGIDPISGDALDSSCPVCSGIGYLVTYSGYVVRSYLNHGKMDNKNWVTGGQYFDGDSTAQIMLTPESLQAVERASYLIADTKRFKISQKIYRGVPELNRIILVLKEDE